MDNLLNKARKDVSVDHCISNYNMIQSKEVEIKDEPLEDNQKLLWIKKEFDEEKQKCMRSITTAEQKLKVNTELYNESNLSNTILQKTIYEDVKLEIQEELKMIEPKNGFDSHMKIDTDTGEEPYLCSFCKKSSINKVNLEFRQCKCYDRDFSSNTEHENHIRVFNEDSLYKCIYCEKIFSNKIDHKTHLLEHNDQKTMENALKTMKKAFGKDSKDMKIPTATLYRWKNNPSIHESGTPAVLSEEEEKIYVCVGLSNESVSSNEVLQKSINEDVQLEIKTEMKIIAPKNSYTDSHTKTDTGKEPYQCPKSFLIEKEETLIVSALLFAARWGFPQGHIEIKDMVQSFIRSTGRSSLFKDDRPSSEWIELFIERHRDELEKRKPELFTSYSYKLSKENITKFNDMYKQVLKEKKMLEKPWAIFNIRESGLCADKTNRMVHLGKEVKNTYLSSSSGSKTIYTVLFCISASGEYLPPYTIYKAMTICDSWTKGGPKGAYYSSNALGWMFDTNFENWFIDIFVKHIQHWEKPIILTFDGYHSHLTYPTVKAAIDNNIIIICLPPNTFHMLQPFDFGVYRSIEIYWKDVLSSWFNETQLSEVCKDSFPTLLSRLWLRLNPSDAIAGFMTTGLYPKDGANAVNLDPEESESSDSSSSSSDSDEFDNSTSRSSLSNDSDIDYDALQLNLIPTVRLINIPDDNQDENLVWDELKKRKPELFTRYCANKWSKGNSTKFNDMYEQVLKEKQMLEKPWAIFNIRESGLCADKINHMVHLGEEVKNAYLSSSSGSKTIYTVLFCISASGEYLPPYTIYKAKNISDSWTKGGPRGAYYSCNALGWMFDTDFENWFIDIFVKHVQHWEKPIILTFDGYNSHLTRSTVKAAFDNNIIIICLPPNTFNMLQPFNFGVFGSIKIYWKDILSSWFSETQLSEVCKDIFPTLLSRLWLRLNPSDAIAGFMTTGLYPKGRANAVELDPEENKSSESSSSSSNSDEFEDSTGRSGLSNDSDIKKYPLQLSSSQSVRLNVPDDNQDENPISLPECDYTYSSEINHADHLSSHIGETVASNPNLISETVESLPNIAQIKTKGSYSQKQTPMVNSSYISSSQSASMSSINNIKRRNRSLSPENTSSSKTVKREDTLDCFGFKVDRESTKCLYRKSSECESNNDEKLEESVKVNLKDL